MPSNESKQSISKQTALAMNRALAAEQQAEEAVNQCRGEAAAIIEEARRQARRIQQQTDKRISRISQRFSQRLAEQLKQLGDLELTLDAENDLLDASHVQQIIDTVADELLRPAEVKL